MFFERNWEGILRFVLKVLSNRWACAEVGGLCGLLKG